MDKNFSIGEDIYLVSNQKRFDMHNDFDFHSMHLNAAGRILVMSWVHRNTPKTLSIRFDKVSFFKVKEANPSYPLRDSLKVTFMGLLHFDDPEIMDGFLPDNGSEGHLIIGFSDESSVKIGSSIATLEIE